MFAAGVKVMYSCPESWSMLMESITDRVVAIDCEGTSTRQCNGGLPLMIQIATQTCVVIELTTEHVLYVDQKLSPELTHLLRDPNIIKVK